MFRLLVFLLTISVGLYFRPMSISSLFDDTTVIKISYSNLGIADGETYIENTDYSTLTAEEKTQLLSILSKYTYARKMSTVFSNGSSNGVGSEIIFKNKSRPSGRLFLYWFRFF